jgi:outer membrane protein assembly factor BamB
VFQNLVGSQSLEKESGMNELRVVIAAVVAVLFAVPAAADDCPQFRGPGRVSISQETRLLKSWPTEGPRLLWQVKDMGFGYGSVAVAGGRVFLIGNRGMEEEFVAALDAKDGRPIWTTKIGKVGIPNQYPKVAGARSTPTVDGATLYALGSDGDLVSVETANGKVRWRKNLRTDFCGKPGFWAYAESPLVDGSRVIVTPGGPGAALVSLDRNSGGHDLESGCDRGRRCRILVARSGADGWGPPGRCVHWEGTGGNRGRYGQVPLALR